MRRFVLELAAVGRARTRAMEKYPVASTGLRPRIVDHAVKRLVAVNRYAAAAVAERR